MRLLSLSLPFLLLVSYSLAGPTDRRTTIEIIEETVTRKVVRNVTDPPARNDRNCNCCCCDCETPTTTTTTPEPECMCEPETTTPAPTTEEPCYCKEPTTTPAATPAADPCPCRRRAASVPVVEETTIRQCTCKESDECRAESSKEVNTCMESCQEQLEDYGSDKSGYLSCFTKNNASIIEAETCLFKDVKCNKDKDEKMVDKANWDDLKSINYESTADETIKNNALWERDQPKYNKIQSFFHCTKHCMHNKYHDCTKEKKCGAEMPSTEVFAEKMIKCTKESPKIATAIFNACYCMAWQKGVKELQGSCVVVGNQFYIDHA